MTAGRPTLVAVVLLGFVAAGCASDTAGSGGSPTGTTVAGTTATGATGEIFETATEETEPPEALPSPASVTHGGRAFGLYLAAAPFGSPELDVAVKQLADFGMEAFPGDIACDEGAAEQLGVPSDVAVVAIYVEGRADAEAWAAALDPPPVGIAAVRTFCLD